MQGIGDRKKLCKPVNPLMYAIKCNSSYFFFFFDISEKLVDRYIWVSSKLFWVENRPKLRKSLTSILIINYNVKILAFKPNFRLPM